MGRSIRRIVSSEERSDALLPDHEHADSHGPRFRRECHMVRPVDFEVACSLHSRGNGERNQVSFRFMVFTSRGETHPLSRRFWMGLFPFYGTRQDREQPPTGARQETWPASEWPGIFDSSIDIFPFFVSAR